MIKNYSYQQLIDENQRLRKSLGTAWSTWIEMILDAHQSEDEGPMKNFYEDILRKIANKIIEKIDVEYTP